jgi:Fatty acid desaturase
MASMVDLRHIGTVKLPWRLNLALTMVVLLAYLAFDFLGVAQIASGRVGLFVFTCLTFVAVTPSLWGLAHEGIHDMAGLRRAALKWHADRDRIHRTRFDCAAGVLLLALLLAHYGAFWPLLLLGLYGRALVYSTLDNLPHYGMHGRGDEAARNLTLPAWASVLVLNHNLHRAHHERPNLPWQALPAHVDGRPLDGNYLLAAMRQFRGPIRALE